MTRSAGRGVGRVLSSAGAGFTLVPAPVPGLKSSTGTFVTDVELLSPDRLVRYLGRHIRHRFVSQLASFYLAAAAEPDPERSVASVHDETAGLALSVIASTPFTVTLEVTAVADLEASIADHDTVAFDVPRASLVTASHGLRDWLATSHGAQEVR